MKKSSTVFLKFVLCLVAAGAFSALAFLPQTEGRAVNLDLISIYTDPFILYIYVASVPFFLALYNAFKLLGFIDTNKIFSLSAIQVVKNIKYSALAIIAFLIGAMFYIRVFVQGEDSAGPMMMGIVLIFASSVIATAVGVFQKLLQNAVEMKSENDLTV